MRHLGKTTRFGSCVGLRLSPALLARIRRAAAGRELRVSELCRDAIREHLDHIERSGVASGHNRDRTN